MDGIETEFARQWGLWLSGKLDGKQWSGADLRRAFEIAGGKVGSTQVSRWLNGEQRPSVRSAGIVADVLGVERREAWDVAGLSGDVGSADGPPVVTDPAEAFVAQVRARGLPRAVEDRMIAEVRADVEQRRRRLENQLDTVEVAIAERAEEA